MLEKQRHKISIYDFHLITTPKIALALIVHRYNNPFIILLCICIHVTIDFIIQTMPTYNNIYHYMHMHTCYHRSYHASTMPTHTNMHLICVVTPHLRKGVENNYAKQIENKANQEGMRKEIITSYVYIPLEMVVGKYCSALGNLTIPSSFLVFISSLSF